MVTETTIKTTGSGAFARHDKSSDVDGDTHEVTLLKLKVMLSGEADYWFAQCLEIDYATDGESKEDAISRFESGLTKMVELHLHKYGSLDKFLTPAPSRVLMEYNQKFTRFFWQSQKHIDGAEANIQFFEAAA